MKQTARIATCIVALAALSGCQSFTSALGFGPKQQGVQHANAGSPVFGSEELERGRAALKAGYPGNAIQPFRMAALNEETAPDAFNGLGVAYAQLGRADLAERYFKMALSLDATNARFAANLDRFYNSPLGNSARALAMKAKEADQQLAAAAKAAEALGMTDEPVKIERRGALTIEKAPARLSRTSNRELALSTRQVEAAAPSSGQMASIGVRNPRKPEAPVEQVEEPVAKENEAPARVSMVGGMSRSSGYPVKISLTKPGSDARARPVRANYPLRVALAPAN